MITDSSQNVVITTWKIGKRLQRILTKERGPSTAKHNLSHTNTSSSSPRPHGRGILENVQAAYEVLGYCGNMMTPTQIDELYSLYTEVELYNQPTVWLQRQHSKQMKKNKNKTSKHLPVRYSHTPADEHGNRMISCELRTEKNKLIAKINPEEIPKVQFENDIHSKEAAALYMIFEHFGNLNMETLFAEPYKTAWLVLGGRFTASVDSTTSNVASAAKQFAFAAINALFEKRRSSSSMSLAETHKRQQAEEKLKKNLKKEKKRILREQADERSNQHKLKMLKKKAEKMKMKHKEVESTKNQRKINKKEQVKITKKIRRVEKTMTYQKKQKTKTKAKAKANTKNKIKKYRPVYICEKDIYRLTTKT
jgi:hypothetical protein